MILSATKKNNAAITTKMKTMLVVTMVSRLVGQATFVVIEAIARLTGNA